MEAVTAFVLEPLAVPSRQYSHEADPPLPVTAVVCWPGSETLASMYPPPAVTEKLTVTPLTRFPYASSTATTRGRGTGVSTTARWPFPLMTKMPSGAAGPTTSGVVETETTLPLDAPIATDSTFRSVMRSSASPASANTNW